jgi:hypothetical protein
MTGPPRKNRAPDLMLMKARGERIVMLTAYDATMARLLDRFIHVRDEAYDLPWQAERQVTFAISHSHQPATPDGLVPKCENGLISRRDLQPYFSPKVSPPCAPRKLPQSYPWQAQRAQRIMLPV